VAAIATQKAGRQYNCRPAFCVFWLCLGLIALGGDPQRVDLAAMLGLVLHQVVIRATPYIILVDYDTAPLAYLLNKPG